MSGSRRWKRREFLSRGLRGAAAAGVLGTLAGPAAGGPARGRTAPAGEMIRRTLGRTGIEVPIVGMGVMNAEVPDLVRRAYEKGIRYFDTAAYYQRGRNEEMVGEVLEELGGRKDAIVATKVYLPHPQRAISPDGAKAYYLKTAEESLRRLRTDHVDVLLSHSVDETGWLNNPGVLEALRSLKEQGKTRFIGFSTHKNMAPLVRDAVASGFYDVILTMFNYTLWDDAELAGALEAAQARGIGVVAMKTQCPRWGGHWDSVPAAKLPYYQGEILHPAVLRWALRRPFVSVAIPGYTTFRQIDDDLPVAYDLDYAAADREFFRARGVPLDEGR